MSLVLELESQGVNFAKAPQLGERRIAEENLEAILRRINNIRRCQADRLHFRMTYTTKKRLPQS